MGFKDSFFGRLFGSKPEDGKEDDGKDQAKEREESQDVGIRPEEEDSELPPGVVQLELPLEHELNQLYVIRRDTIGVGMQSLPRLYLEGIPKEKAEKELLRLEKAITHAASARLAEAVPKAPKAPEEEKPGEQEEPGEQEILENHGAEGISGKKDPGEINLDAQPFLFVAADKMAAWVMAFPPVGGGNEIDREMLTAAFAKQNIRFGIKEELFERMLKPSKRYFRVFLAAEGKEAVQGEDGYIVDYYPRVIEKKFEVDEHDRVDYMSLNVVQNADKGDVICEAVPPTDGVIGHTVYGEELPARNGKAAQLPKGRNTEISEDGCKLIASQAGNVEFSGRSFQIKTVLEIDSNVDLTTGNINFLGDVHIRGNVCSGFSVRALGDIKVDGVVESGEVEAGGDLVVVKGIVGDRDTVIRAHHDIYAKYLENCIVHVRGNLQTDCILHSDIYCDGEIKVCSGKGTVIGGQLKVAREIEARIVGSRSESTTVIVLGGQPCADFEKELLLKDIEELEKEMDKLERQPESPAKTKRMGKIRLDLSVDKMKLGQFDKDLEKIKEKLEEKGGSRLKCQIAYPGVVLTIEDQTALLTRETSSCNARLVEGEIQWI